MQARKSPATKQRGGGNVSIKSSGKNATAAQNAYIAKAYDRINLLVSKGEKDKIKERADALGESVNGYINRLIQEDMNRG